VASRDRSQAGGERSARPSLLFLTLALSLAPLASCGLSRSRHSDVISASAALRSPAGR
jgi:hypothetical protein